MPGLLQQYVEAPEAPAITDITWILQWYIRTETFALCMTQVLIIRFHVNDMYTALLSKYCTRSKGKTTRRSCTINRENTGKDTEAPQAWRF